MVCIGFFHPSPGISLSMWGLQKSMYLLPLLTYLSCASGSWHRKETKSLCSTTGIWKKSSCEVTAKCFWGSLSSVPSGFGFRQEGNSDTRSFCSESGCWDWTEPFVAWIMLYICCSAPGTLISTSLDLQNQATCAVWGYQCSVIALVRRNLNKLQISKPLHGSLTQIGS